MRIGAVLVGCVGLALSACSGGDDDAAPTTSARPVTTNVELTQELDGYLSLNFSGTSWYGSVRAAYVEGDTVFIKVSGSESSVCQGVSGFVFSNGSPVSKPVIVDSGGTVLIRRSSVSDRCA